MTTSELGKFNREMDPTLPPALLSQSQPEWDLASIFVTARSAFQSGDYAHHEVLSTFYILSRQARVWATCDGIWLHEQLVRYVTSRDNDHACRLTALKAITNLSIHLGAKLETNYVQHAQRIESYLDGSFERETDYFVKYLFLRIIYQGGANLQFRAWLETKKTKILALSRGLLRDYQPTERFCVETLSESLKILICAYYTDTEDTGDFSDHLAQLVRFNFGKVEQHRQLIFDRIVENCDRIIKTSELKKIAALPLDNYVDSFECTETVDLFFDDLERKVNACSSHQHTITEAAEDQLNIALKTTNRIVRVSRQARLHLKKRLNLNDRDFMKVPEHGDTLAAQLIALFTSPNVMLKSMSAQLFFIISKEQTARFIALTGYGNAAGLLYDAGILTSGAAHGEDDVDDSAFSEDEGDEDEARRDEAISSIINTRPDKTLGYNAVTGRIEETPEDKRSYAQKEREAHELALQLTKLSSSSSPFTPMCIDKNGCMTTYDAIKNQVQLQPSTTTSSSSDED